MKRSAELPLDDGARERAPGRGEHLDDDVPIVTPILKQADHAAARMSAGDGHDFKGSWEDDKLCSSM